MELFLSHFFLKACPSNTVNLILRKFSSFFLSHLNIISLFLLLFLSLSSQALFSHFHILNFSLPNVAMLWILLTPQQPPLSFKLFPKQRKAVRNNIYTGSVFLSSFTLKGSFAPWTFWPIFKDFYLKLHLTFDWVFPFEGERERARAVFQKQKNRYFLNFYRYSVIIVYVWLGLISLSWLHAFFFFLFSLTKS